MVGDAPEVPGDHEMVACPLPATAVGPSGAPGTAGGVDETNRIASAQMRLLVSPPLLSARCTLAGWPVRTVTVPRSRYPEAVDWSRIVSLVPPALVYKQTGFLRACHGVRPHGKTFLHIAAFDIGNQCAPGCPGV